jgi:urease accessory protein
MARRLASMATGTTTTIMGTTTTTTTATAIAMNTAMQPEPAPLPGGGSDLLHLLSWLSPAFPTGAFAYSHGLEWAVEQGTIRDVPSLVQWIHDLLCFGTGRSDAIIIRHAHRSGAGTPLRALADQAASLATSRERFEESAMQGAAFARAVSVWLALPAPIDPNGDEDWPLPVVIGAAFAAAGLDEDRTVLGALHGLVANWVSAAVRLVPLGQTDGLRSLRALEAAIVAVCDSSRSETLDDLGGFCFGAELAAMLHETQSTRLFRS